MARSPEGSGIVVDGTLYLGIDGGATHCRVRLRDQTGALLSSAEGAAANIYINRDTALGALSATIKEALNHAGIADSALSRISAGFGLAGVSRPADAEFIVNAFVGFKRVEIANDAVTACIGAHAGADGGVIIAGTGTAGVARIGGRTSIIGGRGFILGDDGSAARIGLAAMRAAIKAYDGLMAATPLTTSLLRVFEGNPGLLTDWALQAKPGDFGSFAPHVFAAAENGDATAMQIVESAATAIDDLARTVISHGVATIAIVGGLTRAIQPYLSKDVLAVQHPALFDAIDGAIILAGGTINSLPGKAAGVK
jgi:glucosamine kinase